MKYRITAIILMIILIGGTGLNVSGNIIHLKQDYVGSEFSWSLVGDIFENIKTNESQNIRGKTKLAFFNSTIQGLMGKKYIYDPGTDVVKLKNGYLAYGRVKLISKPSSYKKDYEKYSKKLLEFENLLSESGINLLYVQVPGRIPEGNKYSPYSAVDCTDSLGDEFLTYFDKEIRYLKVSEKIENANLDHYDLFYKTDHHWNADCGFFVSREIKESLNYTVDANIADANSYTRKTVKNAFLGSIGRRVGGAFGGYDDFSVLYPNFETNFTVSVEGEELRSGSFEDTVIYGEYMPGEGEGSWVAYAAFCGGDLGLQIVTNKKSTNSKKILLVRDSYGGAVSPYLSLMCKELHIIDLRHYKGISVLEYAKQIGADDVVVLYNWGSINDTCFNFFSAKE